MNANERPLSNMIIKFSNMLIGCVSDNTINTQYQHRNNKLQYNQGILLSVCRSFAQNDWKKK